ncbi:MAG: NAD(P)-dependent oxidoreductase [Aquabacterium sp.]|nr:NAD(P)-dependent oxidoreductase [Aquabacterium sp.]
MRILVTGATGRVGRALVVRLALQHQVLGLDQAPSSTAHWVGDVGDAALLQRALRGVDAVVHTAALHAPQVGRVPDAEFQRVNVDATRALAEAACAAGVGQLLYTSTTALYGDAATPPDAAGWVDETLAPQPRTIYHRSKLAAEQLLARHADAGAFGLTILRMSRCFPETAPQMACARLHRGVDARDVAEAHALALDTARPGSRVYVISGATPFQPADMAALKADAPTVLRQRAPALAQAFADRGWALPASIDRVYSPALARRELRWPPRFGFADVLRQLDEVSPEVLPPGFLVAGSGAA